jgi:hypothetical protein
METSALQDALQIALFRYSNASFVVYVDECYGFPAIICSDPEHFPAIDTGRDTLTTIERSFIARCQFSHDTMDYRPRLLHYVGVASHGDNEPVAMKGGFSNETRRRASARKLLRVHVRTVGKVEAGHENNSQLVKAYGDGFSLLKNRRLVGVVGLEPTT